MKFVRLTSPGGVPIYMSETMMVEPTTAAIRPVGSLVHTQAGQHAVREIPTAVVAMLEAL